jgi:putative hydrolase of the HAD superfamily
MPIKCVFFDFDGVLRNWDYEMDGLEENFGISLSEFRAVAFSKEFVDPAVRGEISDPQWRQNVCDQMAKLYPGKDAVGATKFWDSRIGELVPDVLLIINECKKVTKVALFTNATSKLNQDMKAHGITDLFDYVVNASEIGYAKPEPEVYEAALKIAGVEANEAFFTDDGKPQIETAIRLGWTGYHFGNASGLRTALIDAGVL